MDEIRQAWGSFLNWAFAALGRLWREFYDGVTNDWNVSVFIVLMAVVVIITGIGMFRRRA